MIGDTSQKIVAGPRELSKTIAHTPAPSRECTGLGIAIINPAQCRAARAMLRLGIRDLAKKAGVSPSTVSLFEADKSEPTLKTLRAIQRVFEEAGLEFLNDTAPGLRLHLTNSEAN